MEKELLDVVPHTPEDKIIQTTTAPQITMIRELKPTSHSKILEARVYRKWTAVTYGKKNESGFSGKKKETAFCCILIDQEGNAIQGNMNVKEIDYFSPKIKLGSVYRFSEFVCEPTNPYQQTINNKTSLRFGKATKFDLIDRPNIPHHYFDFVTYNHLEYKIPKEDAMGRIQYPVLTDYIGCLRTPGELKRIPNDDQGVTIYRKVDIENLSGNVVEFTMWDDMAEKFEDAELETLQQPIIIAVSSCQVKKFRDYQLTATSATQYYLNPRIPEADQLRARFREKYQKNPPLRICKTPYEDIEKEKFRNRFPLKTLLKQDPETYKDVRFTTEATVSSINIRKGWYYMSCNECASKVYEEDGTYRCLNHGRQPKPSYRYNFKAYIADPSATVPVTFFSPAADDIVGYSCLYLLAKHKSEDLQEIPAEIFAIEGERNIFQIHYNTTAQTTDFILDQVFNKKIRKDEATKLIETTSATPPTPLAITNEEDVLQKKDGETGSSKAKKALFQDEPIHAKTEKGILSTSMPIPNQQDVGKKKHEENASKTTKRPLSEDEATDAQNEKAPLEGSNAEKQRPKSTRKNKED